MKVYVVIDNMDNMEIYEQWYDTNIIRGIYTSEEKAKQAISEFIPQSFKHSIVTEQPVSINCIRVIEEKDTKEHKTWLHELYIEEYEMEV